MDSQSEEIDENGWEAPDPYPANREDELTRAINRMAMHYRNLTRQPSGFSNYVDSRMAGELRESMEIAWTLTPEKREAVNAILRGERRGWDGLLGILRDVEWW